MMADAMHVRLEIHQLVLMIESGSASKKCSLSTHSRSRSRVSKVEHQLPRKLGQPPGSAG